MHYKLSCKKNLLELYEMGQTIDLENIKPSDIEELSRLTLQLLDGIDECSDRIVVWKNNIQNHRSPKLTPIEKSSISKHEAESVHDFLWGNESSIFMLALNEYEHAVAEIETKYGSIS
eukprot:TRINITY_DN2464_c0_g1_i2.p1 TRINITY_DN2464_c0_g1~~TRINITY_DN2464_c0_g1_i2.p1  ORF type:complete len:118 (+),score=24.07 TRINITY_DN2464_c0_g1_i2:266-619(+)